MDTSYSQMPIVKTEPLQHQIMGEAEHVTHSFHFRVSYDDRKPYKISCSSPGTVLQALQQSKYFKKEAEGKGIIIERKGYKVIIATHFPCCLIERNELLTVNMIPKRTGEMDANYIMERKHLVTFYVKTKGGKNYKTKKLLNNNEFKKFSELCIYAYEGEMVEDALSRDGRFADVVFHKQCELFETTKEEYIEMSSSVDELNGNHFEIILSNRDRNSQQESFTNAVVGTTDAASSSGASVPAGPSQNPPQSISNPDKAAAAKPSPSQKKTYKPIADSEEVLKILRSQFDGLVKLMMEREKVKTFPKVLDLLREEFGKNTQVFWKVSQIKKLVELSESVCQIYIDGEAAGTGFVLFDCYILTNAHVINEKVNEHGILISPVTVTFNSENTSKQVGSLEYCVKQVVFGYDNRNVQNYLDYAFLEIRPDPTNQLPLGLLGQYRPPPQRGGICLIGYPEDSEKRIDLSSIIKYEERDIAIGKHLQEHSSLLQYIIEANNKDNWGDFKTVKQDSHLLTYNTCFFHGSSGSPVFGDHCQLIAMHSGGYSYITGRAHKTQSVIEFAIPLSSILEHCLGMVLLSGEPSTMSDDVVKGRISFIARFIAHILLQWKPEFETVLSFILDTVRNGKHENLILELGLETIHAMRANGTFHKFMEDSEKKRSLLALYSFLCVCRDSEKDRDVFINQ